MAVGWTRKLKLAVIEPNSAGLIARGLDPLAVLVMAEAGVDIKNQRSKTLDNLGEIQFDYVITVCSAAHETCPMFPGRAKVVHVAFDDPPKLAETAIGTEEALSHYRRVRDEIRAFVETLPGALIEECSQRELP